MPKKQKKKINNREKNEVFNSPSKSASDEPVCTCLELDLKPSPGRTSRGDASKDDSNTVDDKYAVMHWSDAYKMDIHDGEPALIIRVIPSSSESQEGCNNDSFIAAVCNVRISPSAPFFNGNISSTKTGTPLASKKKSSQDAASCGEILLSPISLYTYLSPRAADNIQTKPNAANATSLFTPPPAGAANKDKSQYSSPSKSKFSFSKGGAGESLISPSPSKYTSPSGSKFSFSKGGAGDSLLSPGQIKTPPTTTQSTKRALAKVLVIPLINLSAQQICRLCPDVQKLSLCPINDSNKSSIDSHFSSSTEIMQTLIVSKYQGSYVQAAQSTIQGSDKKDTIMSSELGSALETISISFRGQPEAFHIVDLTLAPIQNRQTNQRDDESELSAIFDELDISGNAGTQIESQLLNFVQSHLCGQQKEDGKSKYSKAGVAYRITPQTKIDFLSSLDELHSITPQTPINTSHANQVPQQPFCAGLDSTLSRIKDALLPPLLHPNLFPADGPLRPPKGALLYGPAGVGKSLVAAQIANDLSFSSSHKDVHVRLVQCADILSSTAIVGEAEKLLTDIFHEAERKATGSGGSLVILDDVHLICPRRGGMGGGSGGSGVDQLAGTLLALLDGIGSLQTTIENDKTGGGLVVLAITAEPSLLDPALRRPGRLDVEVEVPVPDDDARADILRFHLSQLGTKQQIDENEIKSLARLAKGFTGADCKLAVKEAVRTAISRTLLPDSQSEQANGGDGFSLTLSVIEHADLEHAIRITKPSAIKSVSVEIPKVSWSDIGGMDNVKALLKESIELPLTHPHLFEMMQVPPPKGILLYGPPGCSKTLMARAIATEGNMNFLAVKGPELLSKWLGESERALASLFRRARLAAPAVIFFDEMDAIASKRGDGGGGGGDRLLSQLLTELDGVTSGGGSTSGGKGGRVVVVGATNRPDVLDAALTRPGRMDRMIYVGLPDVQGRRGIFIIGLTGKDCHENVDISALASDDVSKGYSGAEIIALCRDAALHAIGEMDDGFIDRPQIHMAHLLRSIKDMKPRTTKEMLHFYSSFRGRH
mmetsp:Transcript_24642/g.53152  ORF Transcript_24642/g.53152 Transcript_24642/m.53152 type:complete len:1053 (-) Transcript_24642:109-3267(-)|eukprot:CAMPEP_0172317840 /NCGR_PEP_ID=MMETSP1058-20130122/33000_1 /TAXON_ID=83371 /ORGANISM="Detonula confervacea, Strain CCMP 353" /LENGTH=1052 /DNA_ID=CAMNT_0013032499 /DNA_START=33 /DNA_END=3194 /DNA_ORIENTATION=+